MNTWQENTGIKGKKWDPHIQREWELQHILIDHLMDNSLICFVHVWTTHLDVI